MWYKSSSSSILLISSCCCCYLYSHVVQFAAGFTFTATPTIPLAAAAAGGGRIRDEGRRRGLTNMVLELPRQDVRDSSSVHRFEEYIEDDSFSSSSSSSLQRQRRRSSSSSSQRLSQPGDLFHEPWSSSSSDRDRSSSSSSTSNSGDKKAMKKKNSNNSNNRTSKDLGMPSSLWKFDDDEDEAATEMMKKKKKDESLFLSSSSSTVPSPVPTVVSIVADKASSIISNAWFCRLLLLTVAALYGTNFGVVKILETTMEPCLAATLRFGLGAILLSPALKNIKPGVLKGGLEVGAYNAVGYFAQSEGLMTSSASKSAFICSMAVIVVPILDALFGHIGEEKKGKEEGEHELQAQLKLQQGGVIRENDEEAEAVVIEKAPLTFTDTWLPATLAVLGVGCLELWGGEAPSLGDLWSCVQPLCFGLGFWRLEALIRKYPKDAIGLTAAQLLSVFGLSLVWLISSPGQLPDMQHFKEIVSNTQVQEAVVWTGLVTTAFTSFLEALGMKTLSAEEATVLFSTEPLWGAGFAAVALGEHMTWGTALGAGLIITACLKSSLGGKPAVPKVAEALAADASSSKTKKE